MSIAVAAQSARYEDGFLVAFVELAVLFLGEVEIAPYLAADQKRDAEEGVHGRMADGESVGLGVRADVGQPQGPRIVDQHAQHAAAAGEVADLLLRLAVDAEGQEALQRPPIRSEHADRRVARFGQLGGSFEHATENGLEIEVGDEYAADIE